MGTGVASRTPQPGDSEGHQSEPESRPDSPNEREAENTGRRWWPWPRRQQGVSVEGSQDFRNAVKWEVGLFMAGLMTAALAIVLYSLAAQNVKETLGTLTLFGGAAGLVGGLFGFLFGVPRTSVQISETADKGKPGKGDAKPDEQDTAQAVPSVTFAAQSVPSVTGLSGNTNLEQISDWLTKILVGATLTQLGNIPAAASTLFTAMGEAISDKPSAAAFVGALIVFSLSMGFIFGWIVTRSYVGWVIRTAEKRLQV